MLHTNLNIDFNLGNERINKKKRDEKKKRKRKHEEFFLRKDIWRNFFKINLLKIYRTYRTMKMLFKIKEERNLSSIFL